MVLLDNGTHINTIMPKYVIDHSLKVGPITDLKDSKVYLCGSVQCLHKTIGLHYDLGFR